jgi:PTS system mannose-specific IIB component/fructoselysine and glucoselysine-specific PTS system IIB component
VSVLLFRVDERLIHGQVVVGWTHQLRVDRYVVVDDALARSDWEQDLYRLAAGDSEVAFASVSEARDALDSWRAAPERSLVLTRDVASMLALARGGLLRGEAVNLGGVHHAPGRDEVLTYLHLSPAEIDELRALVAEGARVFARELPDSHRVPVESLLT